MVHNLRYKVEGLGLFRVQGLRDLGFEFRG
jgi:hypothetical protein